MIQLRRRPSVTLILGTEGGSLRDPGQIWSGPGAMVVPVVGSKMNKCQPESGGSTSSQTTLFYDNCQLQTNPKQYQTKKEIVGSTDKYAGIQRNVYRG